MNSEVSDDGNASAQQAAAEPPRPASRWTRLRHEFGQRLNPVEQSAVLSWATFTATFAVLRVLTHWLHRGHVPKGGGISLGGRHFHHYNIGIALLSAVGAIGLRGSDAQRRHPAVAALTERGVDLTDRHAVDNAIHQLNAEQLAHRLLP